MSDIRDFEEKAVIAILEAGRLPQPLEIKDVRAFRKAGIKFRGDGLLQDVTLPEGWKITHTNGRFGIITDDRGRNRGNFFYKVHEFRGHTKAETRFSLCKPGEYGHPCAWDSATESALFEPSTEDFSVAQEQVVAWLNKHYPKWQDPSQYWDDEHRCWWMFWK